MKSLNHFWDPSLIKEQKGHVDHMEVPLQRKQLQAEGGAGQPGEGWPLPACGGALAHARPWRPGRVPGGWGRVASACLWGCACPRLPGGLEAEIFSEDLVASC